MSVEDVEYIATAFINAGNKLQAVANSMREADMPEMYLQITSANGYAEASRKLAGDAELHFDNQLHCQRHGGTPLWQLRQQKSAYNKALKKAKENEERLGIVKKSVPKKKPKN